ncbi:MAG: hypothetical protein N4A45_09680 [Flavobacteriales bacterium]|jgi:hypothetical protein|nr:hypothetical protein [Flavobacteriales bacterium]
MIKSILKGLKRKFTSQKWYHLRSKDPISNQFGFDRGTPIDRAFIEYFLEKQHKHILGSVLEISESTYSLKYGSQVTSSEILHYDDKNPNATIVGDLTKSETLPNNRVDCFICTQTLNFIEDFEKGIEGGYHLLKDNGVMLTTVAGLCQISRYDMDRWGDYWRFTDLSIKNAFERVFGKGNVEIEIYGNVLAATSILHGITAEELTNEELFYKDPNYQVTIGIKATKNVS